MIKYSNPTLYHQAYSSINDIFENEVDHSTRAIQYATELARRLSNLFQSLISKGNWKEWLALPFIDKIF